MTARASTCSRCARCGATTSASSTARTSTSRRRGRGRSRRVPGGPPVLIGGAAGPKLFAHIAEYADGWIPIGGAGVREALPELQRRVRGARIATRRRCGSCPSARFRRPGRSSTTRRSVSPSSCCASRAAIVTRCCPVWTATPSSSGRDSGDRRSRRSRVRRRRGAPRASPSPATRVASRQCRSGRSACASASRAAASRVGPWPAYRPARPRSTGCRRVSARPLAPSRRTTGRAPEPRDRDRSCRRVVGRRCPHDRRARRPPASRCGACARTRGPVCGRPSCARARSSSSSSRVPTASRRRIRSRRGSSASRAPSPISTRAQRSSVTRSVRSPTRCSRAGASRRFEARRSASRYRSRS